MGVLPKTDLFYKNGQTSTIEYWQKDSSLTLQKTYTIDYEYSSQQLTKTTSIFYNGGSSYYSTYNFSNGNLMSVKAYHLATHELLEEDFYEYDDKLNPFYTLASQYIGNPIAASKNNVIHYKIVSYKHIPSKPELFFEYDYNDKGYPEKKYIIGALGKRTLDESFIYELSN